MSRLNPSDLLAAVGAYFRSAGTPAGDAIRHPNRVMEGAAYQHELGTDRRGASVTANTVELGSKTFAISPALSNHTFWTIGGKVVAQVSPAVWMEGTLTAVSSTSVTMTVTEVSGSGSHSAWSIHFIDTTKNSWMDGYKLPGGIYVTAHDSYLDLAGRARVQTGWNGDMVAIKNDLGVESIVRATFAINASSAGVKLWHGYNEIVKGSPAAGDTYHELNVINASGTPSVYTAGLTPYSPYASGMLLGYQLAGGGDATVYGHTPSVDALFNIANNGAAFWSVMNVRSDAVKREGRSDIGNDQGNAGYGSVFRFAHDLGISWWSASPATTPGTQEEVVRLYSSIDDPDVKLEQVFSDAVIAWNERTAPDGALFQIGVRADAEANVRVNAAASGGAPEVVAAGLATNINLLAKGKGTGLFGFGTFVDSGDGTGYVRIVTQSGAIIRLTGVLET